MPDPVLALTDADYAALTHDPHVVVQIGHATLHVDKPATKVRRGGRDGIPNDARFVMQGPSGRHSLLVVATDLDRLNAHWTTFAAHPLNQPARVAA